MTMRIFVRAAVVSIAGLFVWAPSMAAPVTYEVGGTFIGYGDPLAVPFEGEEYTFQFTYDAEKMHKDIELWGTFAEYSGGLSNFRFSTTVAGQPYEFTAPNFYPGTDNPLGRLGKYDNLDLPGRGLVDVVQAGAVLPNNLEPQYIDAVGDVDGFYPRGLALHFVSFLGLNGDQGMDFVSSLEPEFDPIALAEIEGYGSLSEFNEEPGDGYKGIAIYYVSPEIFEETGYLYPYASKVVRSEFSYIRIIDGPADINEPSPLLAIASGFALAGLYRRRSKVRI